MNDQISRWVNDEDGPPLDKWTGNRFYARALQENIHDPLVVANALALLDAVEAFADRHPHVPFDSIVDAVLAGVDGSAIFHYTWRRWFRYWQLRTARRWRRYWLSRYDRIRTKLLKRS